MQFTGNCVVAPLRIAEAKGQIIAPKFESCDRTNGRFWLAAKFKSVAKECGCHYFDAGSVTPTSRVDGVH